MMRRNLSVVRGEGTFDILIFDALQALPLLSKFTAVS